MKECKHASKAKRNIDSPTAIREFKIPDERNLLTFVRTTAKAPSVKENNAFKNETCKARGCTQDN
jgi:hypothetical protein